MKSECIQHGKPASALLFVLSLCCFFFLFSCQSFVPSPGALDLLPSHDVDPVKNRVVFLGDSGTSGYGCYNPALQSYPGLIAQYLFRHKLPYTVVNAGVTGDTTQNILNRLDQFLVPQTTCLIVLEAGTNDVRVTRPPLEMVQARLEKIIERTQASGIKLVLVRMNFPVLDDYIGRFVKMYDTLAKNYSLPTVDYIPPGLLLEPNVRYGDGHFNERGHREIARNMLRQLNPEFNPSEEELTVSDDAVRLVPWFEHLWEIKNAQH